MQKKWLPNILKDGSITDNSEFQVISEGKTILKRYSQDFYEILRRSKGKRNNWENNEWGAWKFLSNAHNKVQNIFSDKSLTQKSVVTFGNKEYDHNTEDLLFQLSGTGFDNWKMKTGNLVGTISHNGYELKVSSRFGDAFLKLLIADTDGFLEIENFGSHGNNQSYEWLLHFLWKIKLKKAFRLGLPKIYVSKNERIPKVRGNVNILDYYQNAQKTGRFLCSYREHSYDNDINQLINTTFNKLESKSILSDAITIKRAFASAVKGKRISFKDIHQIKGVSNPYFQEYNEVLSLSKRILKDELSDFGGASDTSALLFDVSMLFEFFIRKLISREGYRVNPKDVAEYSIPSGGTYALGNRKLYPDVVFENGSGQLNVFDVKYKRFDFRYGVKREDLFQVHTYLGQVSNRVEVRRFGLIYPLSEKEWDINQRNNKMFNDGVIQKEVLVNGKTLSFEIHFFKVPDSNDENFKTLFVENKKEFIQKLVY